MVKGRNTLKIFSHIPWGWRNCQIGFDYGCMISILRELYTPKPDICPIVYHSRCLPLTTWSLEQRSAENGVLKTKFVPMISIGMFNTMFIRNNWIKVARPVINQPVLEKFDLLNQKADFQTSAIREISRGRSTNRISVLTIGFFTNSLVVHRQASFCRLVSLTNQFISV